MDDVLEQLNHLSPESRRLVLDKLARHRAARDQASPPPLSQVPRRPRMPASFAQQRLWFLCQFEGQSVAYNIPLAVRLDGPLDEDALERSLAAIADRHEPLRTSLHLDGDEVVQQIAQGVQLRIIRLDLRDRSPADQPAEVRRIASIEALRPFDLEAPPLLRATLLRLAAERYVFLLTVHHIIFDGWSIGVFVRELSDFYSAYTRGTKAGLPVLTVQHADFAVWQRQWLRGEVLRTQLAAWRERLAGAPSVLRLPIARPRPLLQSFRGDAVSFQVDRELKRQLKALGDRAGASLFMVLLAAFAALLHRYGAGVDLVIGTPVANRGHRELEPLLGLFVNTLAIRIDAGRNPSFMELLARVRQRTLEAHAHQDLPFERLVEELVTERDPSGNPLIQVLFALRSAAGVSVSGLTATPLPMQAVTSKLDLSLLMEESPDGLHGWLEFSTDLFDASAMERMALHFANLLWAFAAEPYRPISAPALLTESEHRRIVQEWNATEVKFKEAEQCLHALFEAQVQRAPDCVAVLDSVRSLSYRELDSRSNRLAHCLISHGVGPEVLVGVCLDRGIELIVSLLAVLKAGGAYVPLDPSYPSERLAFMLSESRGLLVTESAWLPLVGEFQCGFVLLDAEPLERWPADRPTAQVGPENLAYVIYTSGSTGRPKGAMNSHRAIVNRLLWMQQTYALKGDDRVLHKTPFSFDVSVWELFWPLMSGATMVMARPGGHKDSGYLAELIQAQRVTTVHFVPSMLQAFVEEKELPSCTSLRRVFCSGEGLPAALQERFEKRNSAPMFNLYGPTEAAVDVTAWSCQGPSPTAVVPLGRPVANTQMYVLDEKLAPVPEGVPGELYIAGVQLGRGYLNRPALTAERFIPNPWSPEAGERMYRTGDRGRYLPDGAIEYLGRADDQIKLHGFRIELGEIEAALEAHPAVQQSVVLLREDVPGHPRLVAYVVAPKVPVQVADAAPTPSPSPISPATLIRFLEDKLPAPMIPRLFVSLDELPLTPSGKVDRRALPTPDPELASGAPAYAPPSTAVEEALAAIWARVLGVERVGIHDNFFALGGDSIFSLRVIAAARELGFRLTLPEIFQHQTLYSLAQAVAPRQRAPEVREPSAPLDLLDPADRARLAPDVEDAYPLAALQAGMLFHSELAPASAVYHDVFSYHLGAPLDAAAFACAARELFARHAVLRTSFALSGFKEPIQRVHRDVEPSIVLVDLSHLSPVDQQAELDACAALERDNPFRWERPPLLRFHVHRLSSCRCNLTLGFHHALLDGWSVAVLVTELLQRYLALLGRNAPPLDPPPKSSFRDFVAMERKTLSDAESRSYFRQALAGTPHAKLPRWTWHAPRAEKAGRLGEHLIEFAEETTAGLHRLARAAGVPLKSVLLAAHAKALGMLAGTSRVLTGMVTNGRLEEPSGEGAIGLFLNTLPCAIDLCATGTFVELARAAFRAEWSALPFRRFPLVEIQRDAGGQPLFDTVFNFAHFHVYQHLRAIEGFEILDARFFEQTHFALAANFRLDLPGKRLGLLLAYDAGEIPAEHAAAIGARYEWVLQSMARDPEGRHERVPSLSATEHRRIVQEWNATEVQFQEAELCLHTLFEAQVQRTPDSLAVLGSGRSLSYRELDSRSNRLAHCLISHGVGPEVLVGVCLDRGIELIVSLLAILKAGGAYVPLDPSYPRERLAYMLSESRGLLVSEAAWLPLLGAPRCGFVLLDAEPLERWPTHRPTAQVGPENLAYVIYTSGSTGRPKGAMNSHRAIVNRLLWMQQTYPLQGDDRVLHKTPFSFDVSVWELFWPLLCGATMVMARPGGHKDSGYLAELIQAQRVTTVHFVPSMLQAFVEEKELPRCTSLRRVFCSGEGLPAALQERFEKRNRAPLFNLYGPTEAAVDVTAWSCDGPSPTAVVPLGRPIANTQMYVLDEQLAPVPEGVPGELYIAGVQLGRGYLNRPALTAERFIPNPWSLEAGQRMYRTGDRGRYLPDGAIEYLGRADDQIKLHGFRIELGEIEAALEAHPAVQQSVVLLREDVPGHPLLAAYVVPCATHAAPLLRRLRWRREGRLAEAGLHTLPDGTEIAALNAGETDFLYDEIFTKRTYLKHGVTLRRGDCVFDVGANIGIFSLFAARQAADLRIFAFEPIPAIFEKLRLNAELHDLPATFLAVGLAQAQGRAAFTYYAGVSIASGRFADSAEDRAVLGSFLRGQIGSGPGEAEAIDRMVGARLAGEQIECELRTISEVIREYRIERIDLLKIDVEKSEADVIAGIAEPDWPKIQQIVVEVHDKQGRLGILTKLLRDRGFAIVVEEDEALRGTGLYGIWARRPGLPEALQATAERARPWSSTLLWLDELRRHLARTLPAHMVPAAFVPLDELPLLPSGKLDRRALPRPEQPSGQRPLTLPRTPDEQLLAAVWSDILGTAPIGVDDDFFKLGGHSLKATQVVSRLRDALALDLPLSLLFDAPTIAELAKAITALRRRGEHTEVPAIVPLPRRRR